MIRPVWFASLVALAGCTDAPTGRPAAALSCDESTVTTRYRVDATTLPRSNQDALDHGFDLANHDGIVDNELGEAFAVVINYFTPDYVPDAGAAVAFTGPVDWEIVTETCPDTGESRVRVGSVAGSTPRAGGGLADIDLGATGGCAEVPIGAIAGGPAAGWVLADQLSLDLQLGTGEVTGVLGFTLDQDAANTAIASAVAPFFTAEEATPLMHMTIEDVFDANRDGTVTPAEVQATPIYQSLVAPDVTESSRPIGEPHCPPGVDHWLSFGLTVHAVSEK